MTTNATPARRTKRRYAHELYPHPAEGEVRPLETELPYLFAVAIGHGLDGTDWFDLLHNDGATELDQIRTRLAGLRVKTKIATAERAFMADALRQGLTGQAAWEWVETSLQPEVLDELLYERAAHCGVPVDDIKPYLLLAEPAHHDHYGPPDPRGWRRVHRVEVRESDCPDCTEHLPAEG